MSESNAYAMLEKENAELRASHTEQEEMVAELRKCAQENREKVVGLKAELAIVTAQRDAREEELVTRMVEETEVPHE